MRHSAAHTLKPSLSLLSPGLRYAPSVPICDLLPGHHPDQDHHPDIILCYVLSSYHFFHTLPYDLLGLHDGST